MLASRTFFDGFSYMLDRLDPQNDIFVDKDNIHGRKHINYARPTELSFVGLGTCRRRK